MSNGKRNAVINSSTLIINCTSMGDYENIELIPINISEIKEENILWNL